jgi:hypothetical protein
MELFGIILSIPAAFVLSMIYCLVLAKVIARFDRTALWCRNVSFLVLALFGIEVVLLISLGPVRSRGILGPGFYVAHLFFFFLCTPALANLLVLRAQSISPGSPPTRKLPQNGCNVRVGDYASMCQLPDRRPYGPNQPNALFYCATIGA